MGRDVIQSRPESGRRGIQLIVYNLKSYSALVFLSPMKNGFAIKCMLDSTSATNGRSLNDDDVFGAPL